MGGGVLEWCEGAFLRSEKARSNIDIYRGFIENFSLFWDRREFLGVRDTEPGGMGDGGIRFITPPPPLQLLCVAS